MADVMDYMAKVDGLWCCTICDSSFKDKTGTRRHVVAKHLSPLGTLGAGEEVVRPAKKPATVLHTTNGSYQFQECPYVTNTETGVKSKWQVYHDYHRGAGKLAGKENQGPAYGVSNHNNQRQPTAQPKAKQPRIIAQKSTVYSHPQAMQLLSSPDNSFQPVEWQAGGMSAYVVVDGELLPVDGGETVVSQNVQERLEEPSVAVKKSQLKITSQMNPQVVMALEKVIQDDDWPKPCVRCNTICNNMESYNIHLNDHWIEDKQCPVCGVEFNTKGHNFKVHLKIHTGEKPFKCTVCGKGFRQKAHMVKHIGTHRHLPEGSLEQMVKDCNTSVTCQVCHGKYMNKSLMEAHLPACIERQLELEKVAKRMGVIIPERENAPNIQSAADVQPKATHRPTISEKKPVMTPPVKQKPPSPRPKQPTPTKGRSIGVGGQHTKQCNSCLFTCRTINQYKAHMEGHWHEGKRCADCGVPVKSAVYFKQHLRLHTEDKPYKCKVCNMGHDELEGLLSHLANHSGLSPPECSQLEILERTRVCPLCRQMFASQAQLERHMGVEHGGCCTLKRKSPDYADQVYHQHQPANVSASVGVIY